MITLEPDTHIYRWNDEIVPSVTQIIGSYKRVRILRKKYHINTFTGTLIDSEKMENASDIGVAIHAGAGYILKDGIDWDSLDPDLKGSLKQFEKWCKDWQIKPLLVEPILFSEKYKYAGALDLICEAKLKKKPERIIVDFKTGNHDLAGAQLAAYEQLYREYTKYRGNLHRYVLYLPKDGSDYKFKIQSNRHDWGFFQSRLFQYNYLKQKGI